MTKISDVFAFAVSHVDYWDELLTGSDYPDELAEDTAALDAARGHIEESIVAILHKAAAIFMATEHNPPFAKMQPRAAATIKNRGVYPKSPADRGDLYYLGFCLAADGEGTSIRLYPFITVKKSKSDDVRKKLLENGVKIKPLDYDIRNEGITLAKDDEIETIAKEAAKQLVELVDKSR